jgi:hypothetical protein
MSQSVGYVSADPLVLSDVSGATHLFWAERMIGARDANPNVPDSLMYARWHPDQNGGEWSKPIDIFISSPQNFNKRVNSISGVIDDHGFIHLLWLGPDNTFFYSFARADNAGSAQAWYPAHLIDNEQTGAQYSADVAYTSPNIVHIVYGRSENNVNRTLAYVRSVDHGLTWSSPVDLYTFLDFERGASNVRLQVDGNKLYATWTEWDSSGNGQAIYFARSLDAGLRWETPVMLAARAEGDYERDWTKIEVLGEGHLVAFWAGGFRAYPQAQYSTDGGVTWTEPIDTLFWLIADNGFAEFVQDSEGRHHIFLARRIREGYDEVCSRFPQCSGTGNAIWHSVWESGPNWREPKPVDFTFSPVNFISTAISQGNQLTFAWFDYTDLEVNVMRCEIEGVRTLEVVLMPTITPTPALSATSAAQTEATATPSVANGIEAAEATTTPTLNLGVPSRNAQPSAQAILLSSFVPACALVLLILVVSRIRRRF